MRYNPLMPLIPGQVNDMRAQTAIPLPPIDPLLLRMAALRAMGHSTPLVVPMGELYQDPGWSNPEIHSDFLHAPEDAEWDRRHIPVNVDHGNFNNPSQMFVPEQAAQAAKRKLKKRG